jgi:signal peptidase I
MTENEHQVEVGEETTDDAKKSKWMRDLVRDLLILVIFVFAFRAVVAEANWIPTSSMIPTLAEDDKIIVDKISLNWREIERGDIVTFFPPDAPGTRPNNKKVRFIKRAIGLPGETVEVHKGDGVYINGEKLIEPYVRNYPHPDCLPNYNWGPIDVPEGHYVLLGDNRGGSQDSHVWGFVPEDNIIGRAIFRYWPLLRIGSIEDKDFLDDYFEIGTVN